METLFHLYFNNLVAYGMKFIKNKHAVEDIVMESIYKVGNTRTKDAKPYLIIAVKNGCIDYLRHNGAVNRCHTYMQFNAETSCHQPDRLCYDERAKWLFNAIEQLPKKMRFVIQQYLKYEDDIESISNACNMNYSTFRNQKSNSIKRLRSMLHAGTGTL